MNGFFFNVAEPFPAGGALGIRLVPQVPQPPRFHLQFFFLPQSIFQVKNINTKTTPRFHKKGKCFFSNVLAKRKKKTLKVRQNGPDNQKCLWSLSIYSLIHTIYYNSVSERTHSRQLQFVQEETSWGCRCCVEKTEDLLWRSTKWTASRFHQLMVLIKHNTGFINTLNPASRQTIRFGLNSRVCQEIFSII